MRHRFEEQGNTSMADTTQTTLKERGCKGVCLTHEERRNRACRAIVDTY